jgi:lantibiotic modifying enzyme
MEHFDTEYAAAARHLSARLLALATCDPDGAPVWSGDDVDPLRSTDQRAVLTHGPLDDGLLTGRAGIAVALAAAARLPGARPEWSEMSRAAIRSCVRAGLAHHASASGGLGWSSGRLGLARGARLIGAWTDDIALLDAARHLNRRAVEALHRDPRLCPDYPDLLDGLSGHLTAVLAADLDSADEPLRRAVATDLLARLLEFATNADRTGGLRRPGPTDPLAWAMAGTEAPVIGLAHGGSGVALALAVAASAGIGDPDRLALLVARTRLWEDGWFRAAAGGWPDLRASVDVPGLAWCHGAPGVGIAAACRSRLGASEDAESTYARARAMVQAHGQPHPDVPFDGTLCHGLSGLIELHLAGVEAWPVAADEHLLAARRLARHLTQAGRPGHPGWVCGVPGGRTPMLLTGLAGVAYTLVRCHDPALAPSLTHPGLAASALADLPV